jgi:hypothetical protein
LLFGAGYLGRTIFGARDTFPGLFSKNDLKQVGAGYARKSLSTSYRYLVLTQTFLPTIIDAVLGD